MGFLDGISGILGGGVSRSLTDYIQIESMVSDNILTMKDQSLLTMIEIGGFLGGGGEERLEEIAKLLRVDLSSSLTAPGHALNFVFLRDPDASRRMIERQNGIARRAAANYGMNVDDILSERESVLPDFITEERCLLCVYSRPSLIDADTAKEDNKVVNARLAALPPMAGNGAQRPGRTLDSLVMRHEALVSSISREMARHDYLVEVLDVPAALREVRLGLDPQARGDIDNWFPSLPAWARPEGDLPALGLRNRLSRVLRAPDERGVMMSGDLGHLGVPTFDRQLSGFDAERVDQRSVRIGNTTFSAFDLSRPSEKLRPFIEIVRDMQERARNVPWRASFLIESGGVQAMWMRRAFLDFASWTNKGRNEAIRDALRMNEEIDSNVDTIARMRVSFCTWATAGQDAELRRRAQILSGAVRRWGNCEIDPISGDQMATFMASVPGATTAATAPPAAGPLTDMLLMSPIGSQASPWPEGSVMFRTPTGKIWSYQPGSKLQVPQVNLIAGIPGSGKSVLMAALNLGTVLSQSAIGKNGAMLPRIAIADVGPSSRGFISTVQEALPEHLRHLAVFRKLRMSAEDGINVLDTFLGMRYPLPLEKFFQVTFLSLICGNGKEEASDALRGLLERTVHRAYISCHPKSPGAKEYVRGDDPVVDAALDDLGLSPDMTVTDSPVARKTGWWDIVDKLAAEGQIAMAQRAQRYAVPTLKDLASVASSDDDIQSTYGTARINGEPMIDVMIRSLNEALSFFPNLGGVTRFGLGEARIVSLDLSEVAGDKSAAGMRQTAIMYMLARHASTRGYYMDEEEFRRAVTSGHMPRGYFAIHKREIEDNLNIVKVICYDEYHRAKDVAQIDSQLVTDCREGRKFKVTVNVSSQFPTDFSDELMSACTGFITASSGGGAGIRHIDKAFTLTGEDVRILSNELRGASSKGSSLWARFKIRDKTEVRQHLYLTLGPIELWAFSTTPYDVSLREKLYAQHGPAVARRALARVFPGGSAENEIEKRIKRAQELSERMGSDESDNVIGHLAEEISQMIRRDA